MCVCVVLQNYKVVKLYTKSTFCVYVVCVRLCVNVCELWFGFRRRSCLRVHGPRPALLNAVPCGLLTAAAAVNNRAERMTVQSMSSERCWGGRLTRLKKRAECQQVCTSFKYTCLLDLLLFDRRQAATARQNGTQHHSNREHPLGNVNNRLENCTSIAVHAFTDVHPAVRD